MGFKDELKADMARRRAEGAALREKRAQGEELHRKGGPEAAAEIAAAEAARQRLAEMSKHGR